jgi:tetratricopeptide (TPR) repeat protein
MQPCNQPFRIMRKIVYIVLFELAWIPLYAQNIHQIKQFADAQMESRNDQTALLEYQRVLFFDQEKQYTGLYTKIASIYYRANDFENALTYFNYAWRTESNDSVKQELVFKKVLCSFKQNSYLLALYDLLDMPDQASRYFFLKKNLYLGICYFGLADYQNSLAHFSELVDETERGQIEELFSDFQRFQKKYRPGKVEWMSYFFPGLGQAYSGEFLSGINSFLLLGGITGYAWIIARNYGFIDGAFVLLSWFYRYYSGGALKAGQYAENKIEQKKELIYQQVLEIVYARWKDPAF